MRGISADMGYQSIWLLTDWAYLQQGHIRREGVSIESV